MSVHKKKKKRGSINLPLGFSLAGIHCGIKRRKNDLGLIVCKDGAKALGFFTKNVNVSYSLQVSKKHINNNIKALIVNSGNANCFTQRSDYVKTLKICQSLAQTLKIKTENVLIASTGIIGKPLSFGRIKKGLPPLCQSLGQGYQEFAKSMLTTDTFPKMTSRQIKVGEEKFTITGFAKGAGMIQPGLATMLAFILTDASISRKVLYGLAREAVEKSFNSISVDGSMSTNDSVYFLASQKTHPIKQARALNSFKVALEEVCLELAKMIVKDGEGASKFITINVKGARSKEEAKRAFQAISSSVLLRAAMFGENPNWGRIVASLGQAGIKIREDKFTALFKNLKKKEVTISVNLGRGHYSWGGWCCDITPQYVRLNAGYS
jgi:glutamate N-acetyltransferase/amino-acid N-acetyltransferase